MSNRLKPSLRYKELRPSRDGKLQVEWRLTDTKFLDAVKLSLPPTNTIPIIFVPGIMGSNLCDLRNRPVWLLNSVKDIPIGLAWDWSTKKAGVRQVVLHPGRTKVYRAGGVPKSETKNGHTQRDYLERGWGEVSEASYHKFLLWLDEKMNAERNPADWSDFSGSAHDGYSAGVEDVRKLPSGLPMKMHGLPLTAEGGSKIDPITSDELIKR